jgi:alpha-ketoglutarate-dependent taurine dioxygenase
MLAPGRLDDRAWVRRTLGPADWVVPLPEAAVAELETVAHRLRRDPLPVLLLAPGQFAMPACAAVMATVARTLREGVGLVVLDRLPVDRFSPEESRAVYWLLACLLGRPVAQKWDGTMIYDVRDTGQPLAYGVRRSVTNLELVFHTDAPWLDRPPELVGLLCLHPAQDGGVSRFLSLVTVHHRLRRAHPDLLPRLYRPFPWDRQAEHAPGDATVAWQPVFRSDGQRLLGRCNESLIRTGAELAGAPLDAEGGEALAAMRAILDDPELWVEFTIERGQIQYLDNRHFAHSRTTFRDAAEPERKRHLVRLWNRDRGRRTFHG